MQPDPPAHRIGRSWSFTGDMRAGVSFVSQPARAELLNFPLTSVDLCERVVRLRCPVLGTAFLEQLRPVLQLPEILFVHGSVYLQLSASL